MKILFTCVGKRVELIQAFRNAAAKLMLDLDIYGTDITDTAPALSFCDKCIIVCRISDKNYIPSLLKICSEEKIDAVIPTIDTDLLILSRNKEAFSKIGTNVVISNENEIALCRDKLLTARFFNSVGLLSPELSDDYTTYNGGYPAFIRPKDGSSSINAYKVSNENNLREYAKSIPNYIIAPYISGTEYTVDAFCDRNGNPIFITPRIRMEVRAGEVVKTQICQDKKIIAEVKRIIKAFKPYGAITVQLIRQNETKDDYYIEINPRFGGGAPLSMKAGADSAEMLLRTLNEEKIAYIERAAEDGAVFSRFDQSVRVK